MIEKQENKSWPPTNNKITRRDVIFFSEGEVVKGHLFVPQTGHEAPLPALIVGGAWTTVKEQMAATYAQLLADKGYICLAFDARHFGESEGQPRQYESPERKILDFRNAITFLASLPEVNEERIAGVGICASAGYIARVATEDDRLKALIMVASWLHDVNAISKVYGGGEEIFNKIERAQKAKKVFRLSGEVEYVPVISSSDTATTLLGQRAYFTDSNRGAIPEWRNELAVMSWEDWLTFSPIEEAKKVQQPTLVIHSEHAALVENIKYFFKQLASRDKALRWMEGTHADFYDSPNLVQDTVHEIILFLKGRL